MQNYIAKKRAGQGAIRNESCDYTISHDHEKNQKSVWPKDTHLISQCNEESEGGGVGFFTLKGKKQSVG